MKVTRTLHAEPNASLDAVCAVSALIRADLWRRFGATGTNGRSESDIRKQAVGLYSHHPIDGTIRAEVCKDTVDNIYACRAAAQTRVKRTIFKRTQDKDEQKRLFSLLKRGEWLSDPFLHRMMRKHFQRGVSRCRNQFVVRSDRHQETIEDGRLCIRVSIARKYGSDIILRTTSTGKNVDLSKTNLRVIVGINGVEIHYCTDKPEGRPAGQQSSIGVDKGYTEAFVDSNGNRHGTKFGQIMTRYSDQVHATGIARNRLHAIEKKHREAGRIRKADNIQANNLGRKKLEHRKARTQKNIKQIACKAVHAVVDIASLVVAEDLTSVIKTKNPSWKRFNRRMSAWAKSSLAEALDSITKQRGAKLALVCAAYTSQIDSQTGLLEGKRVGDQFYHASGDVGHADINAARNVLARYYDTEIDRFTPFKEVRSILLARSSGATERQSGPVG